MGILNFLSSNERQRSHVEPEEYDVPLLDHVILPLDSHLPPPVALLLAASLDEVAVRHRLGLDESAFEVAVYHARRPGRPPSPADGPRPRLRWSGREVRPQVQDVVQFKIEPSSPPQVDRPLQSIAETRPRRIKRCRTRAP